MALSRIGAALAALFLTACAVSNAFGTAGRLAPASPVVKIVLGKGGHGSGVFIGSGMYLTAAHVVAGDEATIVSQAATPCSAKAAVVWVSTAYDVALISADCPGLRAARLSCAPLVTGQDITSYGSPLSLDFLQTRGKIAGAARKIGRWQSVYPSDISIAPGMSGGPVMNDAGEIVGINVGLAAATLGFSRSAVGISLIVPASDICRMMGRG